MLSVVTGDGSSNILPITNLAIIDCLSEQDRLPIV